jgi:hypothetical protein
VKLRKDILSVVVYIRQIILRDPDALGATIGDIGLGYQEPSLVEAHGHLIGHSRCAQMSIDHQKISKLVVVKAG